MEPVAPARLHFNKNPRVEGIVPLFEIGSLVTAGYEKLESTHVIPVEGEVGTAVGIPLSSEVRALRWPRHLRFFSSHAFAMSSEAQIAGFSWIGE